MSICLIKEVLWVSEPTGKSVKGPYAREEGAMVRDTLKETEGRPGRQEGSKCGSCGTRETTKRADAVEMSGKR